MVISRTAALVQDLLWWGKIVSIGFLKTPEAWRNAILLMLAFGIFLGVNELMKKVRANSKRRRQKRAERELLSSKNE
jgi:hypothetical protein